MPDSLYHTWQALFAYSSSAFVVFVLILTFLFLVVSQMHLLFFRVCGMLLGMGFFMTLVVLLWPSDGYEDEAFTDKTQVQTFLSESSLDVFSASTWYDEQQVVSVFSLSSLLKQSTCTFEKSRQLKSMNSGFFISLAQTYDLLLHKKSKDEFILQLRDRNQGKVLKTLPLKLNAPLLFKIHQEQFKVYYEYTDGIASVISVTPCACDVKKSSSTNQG